ncbi:MAG: FtsX-like permease family protein [Lachnospiraceae bacterium]|nr:FtsX-like permease family protein [Lachnospiraceae bacterium]
MKFKISLAIKNIKAKPGRSALLIIIVAFLAASVFGGSTFIASVSEGLINSQVRMGADIVVIPEEAKERGSYEGILLQGIPDTFYMDADVLNQVRDLEGVEAATAQFFMASAAAGCCDSPVQIIGFDPETDFSIRPWIREKYKNDIADGDIVVGNNITYNADRKLRLYNITLNVVAQMDKTGTGLDNAVYANMDTIRTLMKSAEELGFESFKDVDPEKVISAVLIRRKLDYETSVLAGKINIGIDGASAVTAEAMMERILVGLRRISQVIDFSAIVIWILSMIILIAMFSLIAGERKKEFAILRILGASKKVIEGTLMIEALFISLFGSLLGIGLFSVVFFPFLDTIKIKLEIPALSPGIQFILIALVLTVILEVLICELTWTICVVRIARKDTGLLSKEGE